MDRVYLEINKDNSTVHTLSSFFFFFFFIYTLYLQITRMSASNHDTPPTNCIQKISLKIALTFRNIGLKLHDFRRGNFNFLIIV
jgi:hypothetical protein